MGHIQAACMLRARGSGHYRIVIYKACACMYSASPVHARCLGQERVAMQRRIAGRALHWSLSKASIISHRIYSTWIHGGAVVTAYRKNDCHLACLPTWGQW